MSERDISPAELEAFMADLICDKFVIDPNSRFCDECGHSLPELREKAAKRKAGAVPSESEARESD